MLPDTVPVGHVVYSQVIHTEGQGSFEMFEINSLVGLEPFWDSEVRLLGSTFYVHFQDEFESFKFLISWAASGEGVGETDGYFDKQSIQSLPE